ncbi:Unknown protein, partial [Striga hermonthica]
FLCIKIIHLNHDGQLSSNAYPPSKEWSLHATIQPLGLNHDGFLSSNTCPPSTEWSLHALSSLLALIMMDFCLRTHAHPQRSGRYMPPSSLSTLIMMDFFLRTHAHPQRSGRYMRPSSLSALIMMDFCLRTHVHPQRSGRYMFLQLLHDSKLPLLTAFDHLNLLDLSFWLHLRFFLTLIQRHLLLLRPRAPGSTWGFISHLRLPFRQLPIISHCSLIAALRCELITCDLTNIFVHRILDRHV